MADCYLNGKFVGSVKDPQEYRERLVAERRKGKITANLNVLYDSENDELKIETSKGRSRRPLIVVREGKSLLTDSHIHQLDRKEITWNDLVRQGIVEYLDAAEEENTYVAFTEAELTPSHTHLEVAPFDIMGLCTSLVPYGNFNQSTRLNAGSKNQKQALGFYASNYPLRLDMDVNVLHTPHRPIVGTVMHEISNDDRHPAGQNLIVAIMAYGGYNMEDAIVMNHSSIQRGLGRSTYFRPAIAEELRYSGGLIDEISIPDKDVKGYKSENDYRLLNGDGIIYPEAKVKEGDVVIGKTSPPRFLSGADEYNLASSTRRESSVGMKHGQKGVIDFVLLTENEEGNKLVQVKIRDTRIPEIGDKFTSRHGQKGVVALTVPQSDMPFSSSGTIPDLIFSPHGIPSRMTISHLIELMAGKTGAMRGKRVDGTTFIGESEETLRSQLKELGFRDNGVETLYDGVTGKKYHAKIFIGNMYYLKLKHMVDNKMHSRARGPIQLLTRQPTEGRAKEGGLRLGEMEKDTFIAHGASLLLKERFDSDRVAVPVCEKSGLIGHFDARKKRMVSPIHGEDAEMSMVEISYAFKLFLDELKSLGIYPMLELKNKY
ncbi:MAG: DNA-directed RNA polymerase subunit B [archaeon]